MSVFVLGRYKFVMCAWGQRIGKFFLWAWVRRGLSACWNNSLTKSNNCIVVTQYQKYQSPAIKPFPKSVGAFP